MKFEMVRIRPLGEHLFGATAGQRDLEILSPLMTGAVTANLVAEFDFSETTSISGSYLRATLGWCLACGRMHTEGGKRSDFSDPWALRPLPMFPVVVGGLREVLEEIHDFLIHRDLVSLLVPATETPPYQRVAILGRLDDFLLMTLQRIASMGTATAQELKGSSEEKITVGGWSNRLVALLAHRLVLRKKEGKTWRYETLGKEHEPWA